MKFKWRKGQDKDGIGLATSVDARALLSVKYLLSNYLSSEESASFYTYSFFNKKQDSLSWPLFNVSLFS